MSLSAYIMLLSRGDTRFVGLPIFTSRLFRQSFLFVHKDSPITSPEALKGARVGVPEFHMTAALFIRGFLNDDYGVKAEDIRWVQGGQDTPGRIERLELHLPETVQIDRVQDRALIDMLASGDLDVVAGVTVPASFVDRSLPIRRLFQDARGVELDWYRRTAIYPIMHLVVIRREVYERDPWLAEALGEAFTEAKKRYYRALEKGALELSPQPMSIHDLEFTWETFGKDFLPYGVERNAATLNAALRYSVEQYLSDRPVSLDELFVTDA
jgi:4,5-dihydroxyphthalate decarboxylase